MLRPDSDHAYGSTNEISPVDVDDWWREVMSVVPMRGYLRGGAITVAPGSTNIIVAPYAINLGDGGERVLIVATNTTVAANVSGALAAATQYFVYVSVSGTPSYQVSTTVPDAAGVFKTADTTRRYLGTFITDGSAVPHPFTNAPTPPEAAFGELRGGSIRCNGTDGIIRIAPFTLTMLGTTGLETITLRVESTRTTSALSAGTRYYVYASILPVFSVSTTAPEAGGVFKSGDRSNRYLGTFVTTDAGDVPAFNNAAAPGQVYVGRLEGGDIRSVSDNIHVAPLKASILNASTGAQEFCETFEETVHAPSLANNEWKYVYLSISGGLPTITSSTTGPDVALKFKSDDTTKLYLGHFRTQGTPHIRPFRKVGRHYLYLVGRANSSTDVITDLGASGQVTSFTDVSLASLVPPTSRMADLRLRLQATGSATGSAYLRPNGQSTVVLQVMVDNQVADAQAFVSGWMETDDAQVIELDTDQTTNTTTAEIRVLGYLESGDLDT